MMMMRNDETYYNNFYYLVFESFSIKILFKTENACEYFVRKAGVRIFQFYCMIEESEGR